MRVVPDRNTAFPHLPHDRGCQRQVLALIARKCKAVFAVVGDRPASGRRRFDRIGRRIPGLEQIFQRRRRTPLQQAVALVRRKRPAAQFGRRPRSEIIAVHGARQGLLVGTLAQTRGRGEAEPAICCVEAVRQPGFQPHRSLGGIRRQVLLTNGPCVRQAPRHLFLPVHHGIAHTRNIPQSKDTSSRRAGLFGVHLGRPDVNLISQRVTGKTGVDQQVVQQRRHAKVAGHGYAAHGIAVARSAEPGLAGDIKPRISLRPQLGQPHRCACEPLRPREATDRLPQTEPVSAGAVSATTWCRRRSLSSRTLRPTVDSGSRAMAHNWPGHPFPLRRAAPRNPAGLDARSCLNPLPAAGLEMCQIHSVSPCAAGNGL